MNIKSLLLGSAAALAAVTGAQAADAIVAAEPEPLEYVRVCDAFGTGYFYIPGTETCLKIGGYVRFQVDIGDATNSYNGNDWDAWTRGRLEVTSKSDTELGTLTGFIAIHGESSRDNSGASSSDRFYFDEVYLSLGGFKAGTYLNWWDKGINGETDANAGGANTRWTSVAYTYTGDAFSAGLQLDEITDTIAGPGDSQGVGVEAIVSAKFGSVAVDLLGSYDIEAEEGAVRLLASAPVGPGTLQGFVIWSSDVSAYYNGNLSGEWAVAASYAIKATDKLTITPGFQYVWDSYRFNDDDWRAGVTLDYAITSGLAFKGTVNYQDQPDAWTGFVRLQRTF
ncbi:porin [Rhizobium puerariae]|uniref:Porin n=1 Tax=Rhizobium puerariae TaxID=1585791 RepID=A0ABV6AKX7_9HYPH